MEFSNITRTPSQPWKIHQNLVNLVFKEYHTQSIHTHLHRHTHSIYTLLKLCKSKASLKLVQSNQAFPKSLHIQSPGLRCCQRNALQQSANLAPITSCKSRLISDTEVLSETDSMLYFAGLTPSSPLLWFPAA